MSAGRLAAWAGPGVLSVVTSRAQIVDGEPFSSVVELCVAGCGLSTGRVAEEALAHRIRRVLPCRVAPSSVVERVALCSLLTTTISL